MLQGVHPSIRATAAVQVNTRNLVRGMVGRPGCGILEMSSQPTARSTRECGADGDLPAFRNWDEEHLRGFAHLRTSTWSRSRTRFRSMAAAVGNDTRGAADAATTADEAAQTADRREPGADAGVESAGMAVCEVDEATAEQVGLPSGS